MAVKQLQLMGIITKNANTIPDNVMGATYLILNGRNIDLTNIGTKCKALI